MNLPLSLYAIFDKEDGVNDNLVGMGWLENGVPITMPAVSSSKENIEYIFQAMQKTNPSPHLRIVHFVQNLFHPKEPHMSERKML